MFEQRSQLKLVLKISFFSTLMLAGFLFFGGVQKVAASGDANIRDFGAIGDGVTDDTQAIQNAVDSGASQIYVPAGNYLIGSVSSSHNPNGLKVIKIHSGQRIYGDGKTSNFIQVNRGYSFEDEKNISSVFTAIETPTSGPMTNITVENLSFTGPDLTGLTFVGGQNVTDNYGYGLIVWGGQHILFQNNYAKNINLFNIAGDQDYHSSDIQVLNNTGEMTSTGIGGWQGISLSFLMRFTGNSGDCLAMPSGAPNDSNYSTCDNFVIGNSVTNYLYGIQWWGNDPSDTADRLAQHIYIASNNVKGASGGIWGNMGQTIEVTKNNVSNCLDVCMDAESSTDVTFENNTAANAGNGVIATFNYSKNIAFKNNIISQDGTLTGWDSACNGHCIFKDRGGKGGGLVTLESNQFIYTGAGIGFIVEDSEIVLIIKNNTFTDITLDLGGDDRGDVTNILGNTYNFTKSADNIFISYSGGISVDAGSDILAAGGHSTSSEIAQVSDSSSLNIYEENVVASENAVFTNILFTGFVRLDEIFADKRTYYLG